ncbi:MAG: hypothetical protein ACOCVF_02840 [bacterium]
MDINLKDLGIKFDKQGQPIGKYYGVCPNCKNLGNIVHRNKNNEFVCYKCKRK